MLSAVLAFAFAAAGGLAFFAMSYLAVLVAFGLTFGKDASLRTVLLFAVFAAAAGVAAFFALEAAQRFEAAFEASIERKV